MVRMNWYKITTAGLLLLLIFSFRPAQASSLTIMNLERLMEKGDYAKVVEKGEKYLEKHPDAKDADEVRDLVMKADYELAIQANTVDGYSAFETKYPASPYKEDIGERKSLVYFETVTTKANTTEAYTEFQKLYPKSSMAPEARKKESELSWKKYRETDTILAYQEFLGQFPDSEHTEEAKNKICDLAWTEAQDNGSIEALRLFSRQFSQCSQAGMARKLEIELAAYPQKVTLAPEEQNVLDALKHREQWGYSTALIMAAEEGHLRICRYLLEVENVDVNAKDRYGRTALHYSTEKNMKICQLLILHGTDVNASDKDGETALHRSYSLEMVKLLIQNGADVNAKDKNGETPLHGSAQSNDFERCDVLVQNGANVNAKDKNGETPIIYLIDVGNAINEPDQVDIRIVELLINSGSEIDCKDQFGDSLLIVALDNNEPKIGMFLIKKGADVNAKGRDGETALRIAISRRYSDICFSLIEKGANVNTNGGTLLHDAAEANLPEICSALIRKGANVNAKDSYGNTPLHVTVSESIRYGDVDNSDGGMFTYYFDNRELINSSNRKVFEVLISHGADVNAKNEEGCTPLHLSIRTYLLTELIEKGADVNARDKNGLTALHYWAQERLSDSKMEALLDAGADIEAKDKDGLTPLHYAAQKNPCQDRYCEALIKRGADVNAKDNYGRTPLNLAIFDKFSNCGPVNCATVIREHGGVE